MSHNAFVTRLTCKYVAHDLYSNPYSLAHGKINHKRRIFEMGIQRSFEQYILSMLFSGKMTQ